MAAPALSGLTAPTGPDVLTVVLPALRAALSGEGPALTLLPGQPPGQRDRALAATRPDLPLERDDVAVVVTTSGSTGDPRGVLLTADALHASAAASLDRLGGPGRWLLALPVTSVAGLQVLLRSLLAASPPGVLDLAGGFDLSAFAAATARLGSDRPRYTALVPTQLTGLLDAGVDLTGYDAVLLGGAAAPPALLARAAAAGVRVVRTYGSSETSGGCVYDGLPLDGVQVTVGTVGTVGENARIRVTGPVLFAGYRLRPELTAAAVVDGWLVTEDLGAVGPDGRLHVLGRADDVIVTGGVKVAGALVEAALGGHPGVREVAVVGRPDPLWGQRVTAVVVPRDATAPPMDAELRSHVAATLGAAFAPREVVVVEALPLLASGKVDRLALAQGR